LNVSLQLAAARTEHLTLDWLWSGWAGDSSGLVLLLLSIFGLLVALIAPRVRLKLSNTRDIFMRRHEIQTIIFLVFLFLVSVALGVRAWL
jgi:hypothetical protein